MAVEVSAGISASGPWKTYATSGVPGKAEWIWSRGSGSAHHAQRRGGNNPDLGWEQHLAQGTFKLASFSVARKGVKVDDPKHLRMLGAVSERTCSQHHLVIRDPLRTPAASVMFRRASSARASVTAASTAPLAGAHAVMPGPVQPRCVCPGAEAAVKRHSAATSMTTSAISELPFASIVQTCPLKRVSCWNIEYYILISRRGPASVPSARFVFIKQLERQK